MGKGASAKNESLQERLPFPCRMHWSYHMSHFETILRSKINGICTYYFSHAIRLGIYYLPTRKRIIWIFWHLLPFLCQRFNFSPATIIRKDSSKLDCVFWKFIISLNAIKMFLRLCCFPFA